MQDSFKYIFRFCCDPGFREASNFEALSRFVIEARIDDVLVFTNVEELNTGHTTEAEQNIYMGLLSRIKALVAPLGITLSINPWHTVMHADLGKNLRPDQNFRLMVDPLGHEATLCVCPLGEEWQNYIVSQYRRYAELQPKMLWVEDDFRFHNHDPLVWGGCFCEEHMALYSELAGVKLDREAFLAGVLQTGDVHPYRKIWLDACRKTLNQLAAKIGKAVQDVSSETRVGLMSSAPHVHCAEGRDWAGILRGLSQGRAPVIRIHLPGYIEPTPSVYMQNFNSVSMLTRALVPEETEVYPELENFPYSRFNKSLKFTRFQLLSAMPLNLAGITLDLYDLNGNGIVWSEGYQDLLRVTKEYLNLLTDRGVFRKPIGGVKVMVSPESSYTLHTRKGQSLEELYPQESFFAAWLSAFGIPFAYSVEHPIKNDVVAISGQFLRNLPKNKIEALFKDNFVILNGDSAEVLYQSGLGKLAGIRQISWMPHNQGCFTYEEVSNGKRYCGMDKARVSAVICASDALKIEYEEGAEPITRLYNSFRQEAAPGLTVLRNQACIFPFGHLPNPLDLPRMFLNNIRQDLLQDILSDVPARINRPPFVKGHPYINPYYYPLENGFALYLVNASLDHCSHIVIDIGSRSVSGVSAGSSREEHFRNVDYRCEGSRLYTDLALESMETVLILVSD